MTALELRDALKAYPDASTVTCDGFDLEVTRPDGSTVAVPVGKK